ncbi:hypothetical protein [Streptomyces hyaluromycini]|nr:hypothetical protein [Streptomyces hyaluromycini]
MSAARPPAPHPLLRRTDLLPADLETGRFHRFSTDAAAHVETLP